MQENKNQFILDETNKMWSSVVVLKKKKKKHTQMLNNQKKPNYIRFN